MKLTLEVPEMLNSTLTISKELKVIKIVIFEIIFLALNFDFGEFLQFCKAKSYQNQNPEPYETCSFWALKLSNIDFT